MPILNPACSPEVNPGEVGEDVCSTLLFADVGLPVNGKKIVGETVDGFLLGDDVSRIAVGELVMLGSFVGLLVG